MVGMLTSVLAFEEMVPYRYDSPPLVFDISLNRSPISALPYTELIILVFPAYVTVIVLSISCLRQAFSRRDFPLVGASLWRALTPLSPS